MAQNTLSEKVQWLTLISFFFVGLFLSYLASNGNGAVPYWRWYLPTWLAAVACFAVGSAAAHHLRKFFIWGIIVFAAFAAIGAVVGGAVGLNPFEIKYRSQLWFDNPNLLAASLVVSGIAGITFTRLRGIKVALTLLVVGAVAVTGSRTAIIALIIAFVTYELVALAITNATRRAVIRLATMVLSVILWQVIVGNWIQYNIEHDNLLYPTNTLAHSAWIRLGKEISTEKVDLEGPHAGGQVIRLQGRADPARSNRILVLQSRGVAPRGFTYHASVYLRADTKQEIELSSNYTSISCQVASDWTRCITPTAIGNGHGQIQFQIKAPDFTSAIDLYIWGPQIQEGEIAGGVSHRPASVIETMRDSGLLARMNILAAIQNTNDSRHSYTQRAWRAFVSSPLTGVGFNNIANWEREAGVAKASAETPPFTHAHNLFVQHLGESGILGIFSFLVPFIGLANIAVRRSNGIVLPLVAAVLVLNIGDFTFYNAGGFYIFWLSLGLGAGTIKKAGVPTHRNSDKMTVV